MKTIIGYGSLICEHSARLTCPSLENFRPIAIDGWQRIFNLMVSEKRPHHQDAHWIDRETKEMGALSVIKSPSARTLCIAFDIPLAEFEAVCAREDKYEALEIEYVELETGCKYSDGVLWFLDPESSYCADDIWPCQPYLAQCLSAASHMGEEFYGNMLSSLVADRSMTIGDYVAQFPERVLKDCPVRIAASGCEK